MCEPTIDVSDRILCTDITYWNYEVNKNNESILQRQFQHSALCNKDVNKETLLLLKHRERDCQVITQNTRGGNAKSQICDTSSYSIPVGYDNFSSTSLAEYLVIPCKQNTYRNYLGCNATDCCSIRHQLFWNHTKKKN